MITHPALDDAAVAALRAAWQDAGSVRVAPVLDDAAARDVVDAVRAQPHALAVGRAGLGFQYHAYALVPEDGCEHLLCRFGRWLWTDGVALASAISGLALAPPPDRTFVCTRYDKGCYLDPHNDHDGARAVAFVLGLTEASWPAEDGGHLEFLATDAVGVRVVERRAPGWNTLDLFDVRGRDRVHAVPIVRRRVERRAVIGWFYPA